jgi:hypothetical protein
MFILRPGASDRHRRATGDLRSAATDGDAETTLARDGSDFGRIASDDFLDRDSRPAAERP